MKIPPQYWKWIVTLAVVIDEDVDVAFLLVDREFEETNMVAAINEAQEGYEGPYEVIEGLMQPKVDL